MCILAPGAELERGMSYNPEAAKSLLELEAESSFSFKPDLWLSSLKPWVPELLASELTRILLEVR